MDKNASILDHYNTTAELNWNLWEARNRSFLLLIVAISLAGVLANDDVLLGVVKSLCDQVTKVKCEQLAPGGTSYMMMHSVILVLVCYYMLTLYHRTASVIMSYKYMAELEKELRYGMGFASGEVAFTREGEYYSGHRPRSFSVIKWLYANHRF